jgi:hypothetical protein
MTAVLCVSTASSVKRLQIELFGLFQWDESHCWTLNSLGNGFSVAEVILVALQVRLHILCRQDPYFMAQFLKLATEVVCTGASLHPDQAWR